MERAPRSPRPARPGRWRAPTAALAQTRSLPEDRGILSSGVGIPKQGSHIGQSQKKGGVIPPARVRTSCRGAARTQQRNRHEHRRAQHNGGSSQRVRFKLIRASAWVAHSGESDNGGSSQRVRFKLIRASAWVAHSGESDSRCRCSVQGAPHVEPPWHNSRLPEIRSWALPT